MQPSETSEVRGHHMREQIQGNPSNAYERSGVQAQPSLVPKEPFEGFPESGP